MPNFSASILDEVDKYLDQKGSKYIRFVDDVFDEIYRYKDRQNSEDAIYRIYTRASKQINNEKLKSRRGIASKLALWRKENPECNVSEIHDIVGITIVTYYESDINLIAEDIKNLRTEIFDFSKYLFLKFETSSSL